jgi:hypothetical protein
LHLEYRWFCRLNLDDKVPHHSTFSENRLNRFRESDILRHVFERVVMTAMPVTAELSKKYQRAAISRKLPAIAHPYRC